MFCAVKDIEELSGRFWGMCELGKRARARDVVSGPGILMRDVLLFLQLRAGTVRGEGERRVQARCALVN